MTTLRTPTTTSTTKPITTRQTNGWAKRKHAVASTIEEIILDFTQRLSLLVESASTERGEELIASIFSGLGREDNSRLGKAAQKQSARERRQLIDLFTQHLTDAIDKSMQARVRDLLDRGISTPAPDKQSSTDSASAPTKPAFTASETKVRRHVRPRPPVVPPPPPLDPEQIRRDAEFARMRVLLRPADQIAPPEPTPVALPEPTKPQRPSTPGESLRALEQEIMSAVPFLADLGPVRSGAQIAVWAGQTRELRDRLPPEQAAVMRPAFRIFFEHLTQLRAQLESNIVDALEPTWIVPDWNTYIEVNRAIVESREPAVDLERLQIHHRTMLRALDLPHRRRANEQASAIITAAAAVLPASDPQLRTTVRRHGSAWKAPATAQAPAAPPQQEKQEVAPAPAPDASPKTDSNTPETPDNDFDRLWSK
jgi:hypothetical protein